MSQPSSMPLRTGREGEPDPLDALRAELATIDQQPVVDRVARFEHANVVLAAALAELDEV